MNLIFAVLSSLAFSLPQKCQEPDGSADFATTNFPTPTPTMGLVPSNTSKASVQINSESTPAATVSPAPLSNHQPEISGYSKQYKVDFRSLSSPSQIPGNPWIADYRKGSGFGTFGFRATPQNVYMDGQGLNLRVSKYTGADVTAGEVNFINMHYGTMVANVKFPSAGSCFGFFLYDSDQNEIDFEFLGKDPTKAYLAFHGATKPIQSIIKDTGKSLLDGAFHEIRIKRSPTGKGTDLAQWWLDGIFLGQLEGPVGPGKIILNNWSTGDKNWSGTPTSDVVAVVSDLSVYYE